MYIYYFSVDEKQGGKVKEITPHRGNQGINRDYNPIVGTFDKS